MSFFGFRVVIGRIAEELLYRGGEVVLWLGREFFFFFGRFCGL